MPHFFKRALLTALATANLGLALNVQAQ